MKNRKILKKWISILLTIVIAFTTTMTDYLAGENRTVFAQEQAYAADTAHIGTSTEENASGATAQNEDSLRVDLYTKAKELETPLAIYNFVKNSINYEYYGGMRKGAQGTYDSLAGNDADTACLLAEMLNAAGYETRYVSGTIRADQKLAAKITGVQNLETAAHIFALSGDSVFIMRDGGGNVLYLEIPHTWLECYVPYTDYRGAGRCQGESLWIPLDAGIKTYEDVDSIYEYTGQMGDTQEEAEAFAAAHPNLHVVKRKIVQQESVYLPLSLPYETTGELNRSDEYNGKTDSITFALGQESLVTLTAPELYNRRLTLCYEEQGGMLRPELKLEGKTIAAGSLIAKGENHDFTMTVQSGSRENVIRNTLRVGGVHAIITDAQSITSRELDKVSGELMKISSSVDEGSVYTDEYLGVLLDYAGKMYFAQVDLANRMTAEKMNVSHVRSLSVGMLGYNVIPEYEDGIVTGISEGMFYTDIDLDFHMAASNIGSSEDVKRFMLASGMISSAYESAIWEQITGEPSVSTVSILNEAYESDNPLLAITDKNMEEALKMLTASPEVLKSVREEASSGKLVLIPRQSVGIGVWNGTGYIVLEGEHYTGQYMINGGLNRRGTNGGSGSSLVNSAYLVNLIACSADIAESLRLIDLAVTCVELGGVVGTVIGIGVLVLCVTVLIVAIEEYRANVERLLEYQSGDESAGEEIVTYAGINIAVTAAFYGTGYLARTQMTKHASKKIAEKLGEETAGRFLKEGADSTIIAGAVRSLENKGADSALIRKTASQMSAAEFERIGALAKKGLSGELLWKTADNHAVLGKVSDSTLLLFRSSKRNADDIITVLLRHGDEAGKLYEQYGDDVIEIAIRYGDEGLYGIKRHGTDFLIEYASYGDEFAQSYLKYGDKAVEIYGKYGDDAAGKLAESVSSFARSINTVLERNGLTLREFNSLRLQDVTTLTDAQKITLKAVRDSVPEIDENTLMQKVIPACDIDKYVNKPDPKVGGFVTRAKDVEHLKTYEDIYDSLRLDYDGSKFNPNSGEDIVIIRYYTDKYSQIKPSYRPELGGTCTDGAPCTGNGFTGALNGQIIPEYKCDDNLDVIDGKIIMIDKAGKETTIASYDKNKRMFIKKTDKK